MDDAVQEARNAEEKAKKAITDVSVYFLLLYSKSNSYLTCGKKETLCGRDFYLY